MKSIASTIALLTVLFVASLVPSTGQAAEVLLREFAIRQRAMVRLGDIADISAATAAERKDLASTPLLPAPARGTVQYLNVSQIRDLLIARGVSTEQLRIGGASLVKLGTKATDAPRLATQRSATRRSATQRSATQRSATSHPATQRSTSQLLTSSRSQTSSPAELELRIQQAIEQHLQRDINAGRWRVEVSLHERDALKVSQLAGKLTARLQTKRRSGRQRVLLSDENGSPEVAISAKLTPIHSVIAVLQSIERGQLVRASDLEIREQEGTLPSQALVNLSQAIGKEALRTLHPNALLRTNDLRAPFQVRKGEAVNVFVRTAGIVIRTRAVAKQDGAMGDLINVETFEDKQKLTVTVSGPGEVAVYATGGRTSDFATLERADQRRR